jgi:chorismate synthase
MNRFGRIFSIQIFGESHGSVVGILIDGCPAGIPLSPDDFKDDLMRRKPGAKGTTPRVESDLPVIESGVYNGFTSGAPMLIKFENSNIKSKDYKQFKNQPRPGHADFTAGVKYGGFSDPTGGGHFSGRLTLALVSAGVIAKKIISPLSTNASLIEAGGTMNIDRAIADAIENKDSIGGIIQCTSRGIPAGLGEPFFDSVESCISHLAFSVPAVKGIEFGSGFGAASMKGSQHNDVIIDNSGTTGTNNAGGINGGISNGNDLVFRVAVKPTSSIGVVQETLNFETNTIEDLKVEGRHDVCIALRVPVIIEAITAIVLADFMLLSQKKPLVW